LGSGRSREELGVNRHGRNISGRQAVSEGNRLSLRTKLTTESAQQILA
jgi:hypothetical protein